MREDRLIGKKEIQSNEDKANDIEGKLYQDREDKAIDIGSKLYQDRAHAMCQFLLLLQGVIRTPAGGKPAQGC